MMVAIMLSTSCFNMKNNQSCAVVRQGGSGLMPVDRMAQISKNLVIIMKVTSM
jgi:hypothetical protein